MSAVMIGCVLAGCSRKPAPTTQAVAPPAPKPVAVQDEGKPAKEGAHGSRKAKGLDVPVFVDGKQMATLRHGELPSTLASYTSKSDTRGDARYFRLGEYLAKIGVSTSKVRAVHLRGNNNRFASIVGDELAREPARFVFDFMEGDTGIAKTRWDTTGLRNTFRIDEIRAVFVYAEQPAPPLDARRSCYLEPGPPGEPAVCSDKIPYASDQPFKGTRIYVDGRLVGQVKRRQLQDSLIVGTDPDGKSRFALPKLLQSFGVDVSRAKAMELVSGDSVVGRGTDVARHEGALTFVLPAHKHGRVLLEVPASWQASQDARPAAASEVTAVFVYQSTNPSKRPITPIPDVPPPEESVQVASNEDG